MAGITSFFGGKIAKASIVPIESPSYLSYANEGWPLDGDSPAVFYFQFFPETVTDERNPNWSSIAIPGGSHPIYQWIQGGDRNISFDAVFVMDTTIAAQMGLQVPFIQGEESRYLRDIDAAVAALRWFTYPHYNRVTGQIASPSRLRLTLEGSKIGLGNVGYINAIMQSCSVSYTAWWPDGTPKMARVSLSFSEVVQDPTGGIEFHDRATFDPGVVHSGLGNGRFGFGLLGSLSNI